MPITQATQRAPRKLVYWHRELPPLTDDVAGEYVVEAESYAVPASRPAEEELWQECHESLMKVACDRLEQEVRRLGGSSARVVEADIREKRDPLAGTLRLVGRFTYILYRAPAASIGAV